MRRTRAPLVIGAAILVLATVIGCGGEEATPEPTPEPTPEASALSVSARAAEGGGWTYDPSELTIPSAGSTTIALINTDIVEHDLTIDELDFQIAVPVGETAEGVLTDVEPGTYRFYCTVPGHEVNGMVGELVVTG